MVFDVQNSIKRMSQAAGTQMPEEVCADVVFMLPGEGNVGGGQHNTQHWRWQWIDFTFSGTFKRQKPETPTMPKVEQAVWFLLWIQKRAAKIREVEHLTHDERLRDVVLVRFKQERLQRAILACTNTPWEDAKRLSQNLPSGILTRSNGHKLK